jgi:hypothetical protein
MMWVTMLPLKILLSNLPDSNKSKYPGAVQKVWAVPSRLVENVIQ